MPTIDITDDHRDRIEALRKELTATHAGPYASVDTEDTLAYLLDLAEAVDDPDRTADPDALAGDEAPARSTDGPVPAAPPFDRENARARLESRPRRHSDRDAADEPDLYDIAAAFDVTGRSDMTKPETIAAILDAAASLSADPFAWAGVDLGEGGHPDRDEAAESEPPLAAEADGAADSDGNDDADGEDGGAAGDSDGDDAGASQLNAMMSLLDTHADKWREGDGDARYEVDLPDGDVETARTKDDVRALLFRNY